MNTCFWHNFLPVLSHGWHFSHGRDVCFLSHRLHGLHGFSCLNQNEKNGKEYSLMSHGENIFLSHTESTESTEFPLRGAFCHTDCTDLFFSIRMKRMKKNILLCHTDGTNPLISIRF